MYFQFKLNQIEIEISAFKEPNLQYTGINYVFEIHYVIPNR
jgi:hypothetical protein